MLSLLKFWGALSSCKCLKCACSLRLSAKTSYSDTTDGPSILFSATSVQYTFEVPYICSSTLRWLANYVFLVSSLAMMASCMLFKLYIIEKSFLHTSRQKLWWIKAWNSIFYTWILSYKTNIRAWLLLFHGHIGNEGIRQNDIFCPMSWRLWLRALLE